MRFPYIPVWLPVDVYLAIGSSRRRLLEMPTVIGHAMGPDHKAFRFECRILLHICIIVDVKRKLFNAVNQQRQQLP